MLRTEQSRMHPRAALNLDASMYSETVNGHAMLDWFTDIVQDKDTSHVGP
jgi:hypothetical protein